MYPEAALSAAHLYEPLFLRFLREGLEYQSSNPCLIIGSNSVTIHSGADQHDVCPPVELSCSELIDLAVKTQTAVSISCLLCMLEALQDSRVFAQTFVKKQLREAKIPYPVGIEGWEQSIFCVKANKQAGWLFLDDTELAPESVEGVYSGASREGKFFVKLVPSVELARSLKEAIHD